MNIWLSFVVPVYKVEKYLDKCVTSILNQQFDDIEIILVDDGSPDACPLKCDDYMKRDPRVRVIHKENEGVSKARAVGIDLARGEYIACVDSDDWIAEDYCASLKAILDKCRPSVIKYGYYIAEEKKTTKAMPDITAGYYSKEELIEQVHPIAIEASDGRYIYNALWTCIVDSKLLKKYCLTSRVVMGEDAATLKSCIINASSMEVIAASLYFYRKSSTSIIQSRRALPWDGPQLIKEHYEATLRISNLDIEQQIQRNTIHNLFNVAISQFYQNAPYRLISRDIRLHLQNAPYKKLLKCYRPKSETWKLRVAYSALKHRWCWLMWLYSKVAC